MRSCSVTWPLEREGGRGGRRERQEGVCVRGEGREREMCEGGEGGIGVYVCVRERGRCANLSARCYDGLTFLYLVHGQNIVQGVAHEVSGSIHLEVLYGDQSTIEIENGEENASPQLPSTNQTDPPQ